MTETDSRQIPEYQFTSWELNREQFPELAQKGFEAYAANLGEKLLPAFTPNNNVAGCADEGINTRFRIAGSGILSSKEEAAKLLQSMGAKGVTSHEGCGAAKAVAAQNNLPDAEAFAQEWTQDVAQLAGIPYEGHTRLSQMRRPNKFHDASVAYVDETNSFNPLQAEGLLPNGFVISAGVLPEQQKFVDQQVDAIVGIAMNHGIGEKLLKRTPFTIVDIRSGEEPSARMNSLQERMAKHEGLVNVQSMRVPQRRQSA